MLIIFMFILWVTLYHIGQGIARVEYYVWQCADTIAGKLEVGSFTTYCEVMPSKASWPCSSPHVEVFMVEFIL